MNQRDAFDRVVASLHEAALGDAHLAAASLLIGEACGSQGSSLLVGQGPTDNVRVNSAGYYLRGERRDDIHLEYLTAYHSHDERVPRVRQLPDSRVVHVSELYSARELKTSPTYNEFLPRISGQNSLLVRLVLSPDAHLTLCLPDPVQGDGWGSNQIEMIERLLPHIRQFARVRRTLAGAKALGASLTELLDNALAGVIHLDRSGRIVGANDRARAVLGRKNGLRDEGGLLSAWLPADRDRLERLLAEALSMRGSQTAGGSMLIRRPSGMPGLTLHVHPVRLHQMSFGTSSVAALVLVMDVASRPTVDARLVSQVLGLTPAEGRVAVLLASGKTVPEIAFTSGREESTIQTHIKRIHHKLGVSRRADLVRLVLSAGASPDS